MTRIAVVGSAPAATNYLQAVQRVPNVEPVSSVGDVTKVREAGSLGGILDSLVASHVEEFDAVVLCDTDVPTCAQLRQLIEHGKHVLTGAPLARDVEDVRALHELASRRGVTLATERLEQSHPYFQTIQTALRSNHLGVPGLLRIHDWKTGPPMVLDESTQFRWMESQIALASRIFEEAPDHLLALPICSDEQIQGIQLHLGFPSGGMALTDGGCFLPAGTRGYLSISVIAAGGAAYADDHRNTHLRWDNQGCVGLPMTMDVDTHIQQLRTFMEGVGDSQVSWADQDCQAVVAANVAMGSLAARQVAVIRGEHDELT